MLQKQLTIAGELLSRLLDNLNVQPKKEYAPGIFVLQMNKAVQAQPLSVKNLRERNQQSLPF